MHSRQGVGSFAGALGVRACPQRRPLRWGIGLVWRLMTWPRGGRGGHALTPVAGDHRLGPCHECASPAAYARPIRDEPQQNQRPEFSRSISVLTPPDRPYPLLTSSRERAHGQRPMRRRGAIERVAPSAEARVCRGLVKPCVSGAGRACYTDTTWREGRRSNRRALTGSRSGTGCR